MKTRQRNRPGPAQTRVGLARGHHQHQHQPAHLIKEKLVSDAPSALQNITFPGTWAAFRALVSTRFCAAIWCHFTDCDEVFNYWEPLHYLIYGVGLQTWEYSADFALRSYASLWIVGTPSGIIASITSTAPTAVLYLTRCMLALAAAISDVFFYKSICREFGVHVGRIWLAFALTSSGGFISGAAMLPSAWCGILSSLAIAAWWKQQYPLSIFFTAMSAIFGWPFAGLLGLPIAIDLIFVKRDPVTFIQWSVISLVTILGPMVFIDSGYYGKWVVAPFNLIKYNMFTSHGPNLYGTEPWTFYLINGFLNFNIVWVLALACPVLLIACKLLPKNKARAPFCQPYWLSLMPLYSWLIIFMLQPHKEERFLFPIYNMICLCGAIGVDCIQKLFFNCLPFLEYIANKVLIFKKKRISLTVGKSNSNYHYISQTKFIMFSVMAIATLMGVSRSISIYRHYHAPMDILRSLNEEEVISSSNINVCYGKEWYRFPSSFLFPDQRYRIKFIKSEFNGMLPAYYSQDENATMLSPKYFNDKNQEDVSLYTNVSECHYLVDSTIGSPTTLEPRYSELANDWTLVKALPFLDAEKSDRLYRAFYIPIISDLNLVYGEIQLLRSTKFKIN